MRRKLIKQDDFNAFENQSVTSAAHELSEASGVLAHALKEDHLILHSFNESTVMYETLDGSYVHAGYQIKDNTVTFNDIEELVIDESSRKDRVRSILSEMTDAILTDDKGKAKSLYKQYLEMVDWRKAESKKGEKTPFTEAKHKFGKSSEDCDEDHKDDKKKLPFLKKKVDESGSRELATVFEVSKNVLDYVDYVRVGPALRESISKTDEKGNVTDLRIPSSRLRNEGKILEFDWKTLNNKVKTLRNEAVSLCSDEEFCKAVSHLRRQNALSDASRLSEALDHVVKSWPSVLYVTQSELSKVIGEALEIVGESNYDDQVCDFMSEGILRHAHKAYSEKVNQIMHLARAPKLAEGADAYGFFQHVVEQFYPTVDERFGLERKVFSDLYESLAGIHKQADRIGNEALKKETASYLNELADVLNGEIGPSVELAEDVAVWMQRFVEANVEGSSEKWNVSNSTHVTVSGDHPQMAKNAKVPAVAGRYTGDWGDEAPMIKQDSMSYKGGAANTARNNSWGNVGGNEVFPSLNNPYVPKPFGDYTMKGEKGVDKDATGQHWSTWQSSATWPKLQNPYVPGEAGGTGGKGHKMKDGPETDLVVDR